MLQVEGKCTKRESFKKMKAIVYHNAGDLRLEVLPKPDNNPQELLVKIDACAVCGTDLKSYRHGNPRIKPPLHVLHSDHLK